MSLLDAAPEEVGPKWKIQDADYVLIFRLLSQNKKSRKRPSTAEEQEEYTKIIERIISTGLSVQARQLEKYRIAIFIHASDRLVKTLSHRSKINDWLNSVGSQDSSIFQEDHVPPQSSVISAGERLRLIYESLISAPVYAGGCGLFDGAHDGLVESIFPLHDQEFNDQWTKSWDSSVWVSVDDLTRLRNHHGEKVAYYFAFTQFYFVTLSIPSVIGIFCYIVAPSTVSTFYIVALLLWSLFFLAFWNQRAKMLSVIWSTRNFNSSEVLRPNFNPERFVKDVTGKLVATYPTFKRFATIAFLRIPFEIILCLLVALAVTFVFAVEMVVTVYYNGPGKQIAAVLPTILYVLSIPTLSAVHGALARKLTALENYPTDSAHTSSLTQKVFLFNSVVSFLSLALLAFVFLPFREELRVWAGLKEGFTPSVEMLVSAVLYTSVTGQVVNAFTETILPVLQRRVFSLFTSKVKDAKDDLTDVSNKGEATFLQRVRHEASLPPYEVYDDYAELTTQFGFVMLFSPFFPLSPLASFVNNFLELRSDAHKMCINSRRPIPKRAENIDPWNANLILLSWLGSLSCGAIMCFYGAVDSMGGRVTNHLSMWDLVFIMGLEHLWILSRVIVDKIVTNLPSKVEDRIRQQEWELRKKHLEESNVLTSNRRGSIQNGLDIRESQEFKDAISVMMTNKEL